LLARWEVGAAEGAGEPGAEARAEEGAGGDAEAAAAEGLGIGPGGGAAEGDAGAEAEPWSELERLAVEQQVLPALHPALGRAAPAAVAGRMLAAYIANVRRNEQARGAAAEVVKLCRDRDIPVMALKGLALLESGVYGDDALRSLADVDLLVPSEACEGLYRELLRAGWRRLDDGVAESHYLSHSHQAPPLLHPATGMAVEIHREPLPRVLSLRGDAHGLWSRALESPAGGGLRIPAPADLVVQAALHTLLHGTARLMGLADIAACVRRGGVRPEAIRRAAAEVGAVRQVAAMVSLALRTCGPRREARHFADQIDPGADRAMTRTGAAGRLLRRRPHWIADAPLGALHADPVAALGLWLAPPAVRPARAARWLLRVAFPAPFHLRMRAGRFGRLPLPLLYAGRLVGLPLRFLVVRPLGRVVGRM